MINLLFDSSITFAGMPSVLPLDPETYQRLSGSTSNRLQAISFFLMGLLLCSGLVFVLWNYVRKDFPLLPRLSFTGSLAATILWGLLFVIVLTMISGARELMTPGAWQKKGHTHALATRPPTTDFNEEVQVRKLHLEKLQVAIWQYAATHQGKFPAANDYSAIPNDKWNIPQAGGLQYILIAEQSANGLENLLVFEPELEFDVRWALLTNGKIVSLTSAEIKHKLER